MRKVIIFQINKGLLIGDGTESRKRKDDER